MIAADQHVVLIGMMGAGKSTIGRALAERMRRTLLDTDQMVESRAGRSVRRIFADDGEAVFRAMETAALGEALAASPPVVVAAAGGVVLAEANRSALAASGAKVVWLCASPALLARRTARGGQRRAYEAARPEHLLGIAPLRR